MNNMTVGYIINFVNSDAVFKAFSVIICLISFSQEALERYREKKWRKTFLEAVLLSAVLVVLWAMGWLFPAMLPVALVVLALTYSRRIRNSRKIKANLGDQSDAQARDMLADSAEGDYVPRLLDFSESAFKSAEQCLAEKRPKAAISYLNQCRGKERNQLRFVTRYADALIMLENYEGALAKLDALSAREINKKRRYKSVMIRKATCFYGLNRYMEELECYNKVIASNYKPEKYYYYRGKIKTRLLEKLSYVREAETAVSETYGSKQGLVESALADFDRALGYGDKYRAKILSYMGSCQFHLQEKQKALDLFYESEGMWEHFENNYVYFGIYHYGENHFDEAVTYLEKGIAYGAADEVSYLYLARICFMEKRHEEAIRYAAKALSVFPRIDECYGIQGNCYYNKRMYAEAIACYTQAIALNPEEQYFRSRAVCYYNKKSAEYRKAYEDIRKAREIKDSERNRVAELLYLTAIDREEGKGRELEELERLVQPFSENSNYYNDIGLMFDHYGYLEEAAQYFKRGIEHSKSDSAHYNLALILHRGGILEEAAEHLEVAVDLDPMSIKYHNMLLKCYRDLGNTDKEIEVQVKIGDLKKKYLKVNKENGDAVYCLGKYHAAEKYYRSALEYVSQDSAVLNNLACALYYQEKYEEAVECLRQSVTRKESHLAYFNLGNCCLGMGDRDGAVSNYRTAHKLSVEFEPAERMLRSLDPSEINMVIDSAG